MVLRLSLFSCYGLMDDFMLCYMRKTELDMKSKGVQYSFSTLFSQGLIVPWDQHVRIIVVFDCSMRSTCQNNCNSCTWGFNLVTFEAEKDVWKSAPGKPIIVAFRTWSRWNISSRHLAVTIIVMYQSGSYYRWQVACYKRVSNIFEVSIIFLNYNDLLIWLALDSGGIC